MASPRTALMELARTATDAELVAAIIAAPSGSMAGSDWYGQDADGFFADGVELGAMLAIGMKRGRKIEVLLVSTLGGGEK